MKRNELNGIYTATVMDYIAKGYIIHTEEMGGSQGQIAAIHLTNGNELIAVIISNLYEFTKRERSMTLDDIYEEGIEIVVKRLPMPKYNGDTVWLNKGEVISVRRFYEITEKYMAKEGWYTEDREEQKACKRKHYSRRTPEKDIHFMTMTIDGKLMQKIHSVRGCKNAKLADVEISVSRKEHVKSDAAHPYDFRYSVSCNGHRISL